MAETRKIAAILGADVVGFRRMAGADEDRTPARLRALRRDLIDPMVALHNGRVFKRTGDGALIKFRSVVDAVRCAIAGRTAWPSVSWAFHLTVASPFASAFIWATWSRRAMAI
jgi:adenylate cyclase